MEKFDFVLGVPVRNRAVCSLCSYGEHAVFTIVKNTVLPVFEHAFYEALRDLGLSPAVEGTA